MPNAFISYSRQDSAFAKRMARDLRDAGLEVWIDSSEIAIGTEWQQEIFRALGASDFVVVCLTPEAVKSEGVRREILLARGRFLTVIPLLVKKQGETATGTEATMDLLLKYEDTRWLLNIQMVDFEEFGYEQAFRLLLERPLGVVHSTTDPTKIPNPFKGLEAFQQTDAHLFFGREELTQKLLDRLSNRFLAVVGASGSGKSSLIRAGLIPSIRAGALPGSEEWPVVILTPGVSPIDALALRLTPVVDERGLGSSALAVLEKGAEGLEVLVESMLTEAPATSRLVLAIDQFEEVFTRASPRQARPFLDMLHAAVTMPSSRVAVVLTLRADFFDRLSGYPELAALFEQENMVIVTEMSPEALRESIEKPAQVVGLRYESGLVERILEDVRSQPGTLPLMEYALKGLYERREGYNLTNDAYEAMRGVHGAIGERAEAIYTLLEPDVQAALPEVFRELVEVDDERGEPTRRRALLADVATNPAAATLVEAFTSEQARLLVQNRSEQSSESVVEVAHEALLRSWQRLSEWIEAEQGNLRFRRQIERAAQEWETRARQSSWLLNGGRLVEAQEWQESFPAGALEQEFIDASAKYARRQRLQRRLLIWIAFVLLIIVSFILARSNADLRIEADLINTRIANNRLEVERFSTLEAGDVIVPLLTQTPDQFIPTLTKIAVLTAHDPSLAENHLTDDFGVEMVYVPEGCFFMGSDRGLVDEQPSHQVCLDAFWIDRYEVTNEQFGRLNGVARLPGDWPQPLQPRTSVNWLEARNFCLSREARLPTEAEWEYAARGPDGPIYPWGNDFEEPNEDVAYPRSYDTLAEVGVDQRPGGASWAGAYDMSGNVWEWVSTIYDQDRFPYPYAPDDGREDIEDEAAPRVMRGAGILDFDDLLRSAKRSFTRSNVGENDIGFRCARTDGTTQ